MNSYFHLSLTTNPALARKLQTGDALRTKLDLLKSVLETDKVLKEYASTSLINHHQLAQPSNWGDANVFLVNGIVRFDHSC